MTDPGQGDSVQKRRIIYSCLFCILFCLLFFGVLHWFSFEKNLFDAVITPYRLAAHSIADDVETGLKLGKTLDRFSLFSRLVEDALHADPHLKTALLLDDKGRVVEGRTERQRFAIPEKTHLDGSDQVRWRRSGGDILLFKALRGTDFYTSLGLTRAEAPSPQNPDGKGAAAAVGSLLLIIDHSAVTVAMRGLAEHALWGFTLCIAAALILFLVLLRFIPFHDGHGAIRRGRLLFLVLVPLLLVQAGSALFLFQYSHRTIAATAQQTTRTSVEIVHAKLQGVLNLGIRLEEIADIKETLARTCRLVPSIATLQITTQDGRALYGAGDTAATTGTVFTYPLSTTDAGGRPQTLLFRAGQNDRLFVSSIRTEALNAVSILIVSILLMSELLLLQTLLFGKPGEEQQARRHKGWMRAIGFGMVLALDLSISFIPMQMERLIATSNQGRATTNAADFLLSLPVSVEMAAASLGILLASLWAMRHPAVHALIAGLALAALGSAFSALAPSPELFIGARFVVGTGYGLALMALITVVVACSDLRKQGSSLTLLFAGVYAGALCGGVMGGMLAERFGFTMVFSCSALLLSMVLFICLHQHAALGGIAAVSKRKGPSSGLSLAQLRRFCTDRNILGLMVLNLFPGALIAIGLLNYFFPLFLSRSGVQQSDIGRVFMLYGLVFVFLGPGLGRLLERLSTPKLSVFLCSVMGSATLLLFALPNGWLSPLVVALVAAVLLGLFLAGAITAHTTFLLSCRSAVSLGQESAMSLYNLVERLGQVAGPLLFGAGMAMMQPARFALLGGLTYLVLAIVFLLVPSHRPYDAPSPDQS